MPLGATMFTIQLLAVGLPFCDSSCSPSLPPVDSCAHGQVGTADSLQIGDGNFGADDAPFSPWVDGDHVCVRGAPQGGAPMIVFRIRLTGDAVPSCLTEESSLLDQDGTLEGRRSTPLNTYLQSDGSRITHATYIQGVPPDQFTFRVEAAGLTTSVKLENNCDSSLDLSLPDLSADLSTEDLATEDLSVPMDLSEPISD